MKRILTLAAIAILLTSCNAPPAQPTPFNQNQDEPAPVSTVHPATFYPAGTAAPTTADMPNPASASCIEQGFESEIRTAADGSQSGVCIFADGSECDEWAYLRGERDLSTLR